MILRINCQACGIDGRATTHYAQGLALDLVGAWRARNAPYAIGPGGTKLPGASMVILCSDVCEERYRREIGLVD